MHIVLADDHKLVLQALDAYLTTLQPDIEIALAGNFDDALELVTKIPSVDLAILDLHMPGMNGLDGLRVIRERHPDLPVVIMSGAATSKQVREALNSGASGFIPKDLSGQAMLRALELVLSGDVYVPSMILADSGGEASGEAAQASEKYDSDNPLSRLTRRENDVLSLLIKGHSNKKIARELGLKDVTAAFHLRGVYQKLGVSNRTEAVITALRYGQEI